MKRMIIPFLISLFFSITIVQAQQKETREVSVFREISYRVPGKLYLRQGSPQKVELEADAETLKKIVTRTEGDRLIIETENKWFDWSWGDDDVIVYITMKDIEALSVSGSGDLIAQSKINAQDLRLAVSGSGSLKAEVAVQEMLEANVSGSGNLEVTGKSNDFNSAVSGSGRVSADRLTTGDVKMNVSGSGKIQASGTSESVTATVSGSGKILAADLEASECDIRISGSGDVEVNAKEELDVTISGSGTVSYKGSPRKVNSHSSGSGSVKKI